MSDVFSQEEQSVAIVTLEEFRRIIVEKIDVILFEVICHRKEEIIPIERIVQHAEGIAEEFKKLFRN